MSRFGFITAAALASAIPAFAAPAVSQATPAAASMTDTASNGDKVVCRRSVDTGSLVRGRNVCKTRRAWQLEAEESRREVQNLQDHGLINSVKSQ